MKPIQVFLKALKTETIFSIAFYLLSGCFNFLHSQQLPVLDLETAINHPNKIVLSDFIENLTYIVLETNQDCLIDANPKIIVTKDYIVINTQKQCLLFDRKGGYFIREIGRYGRGPGEYRNTNGFFDETSLLIYFTGWGGNLIKYSLDGKSVGSLPIPGYKDDLQNPSMPDKVTYLKENLFVCNFFNINGIEPKSIMIFNNKSEIIRIFSRNNNLKKMNPTISTGKTAFHHFNNSVFFQEYFNDTVFKITSERITPYFILNKGKYRPPYESYWWPIEKLRQAMLMNQPVYFENSRFISFEYFIGFDTHYFGLYDKMSKSLKIKEYSSGLINDIDHFMDLRLSSINEDGELSCLIQSQDLIRWFEINKDKSKSLKSELQTLKNVQPDDNPIVVIAKYKQ
jgi:hypothetical protein